MLDELPTIFVGASDPREGIGIVMPGGTIPKRKLPVVGPNCLLGGRPKEPKGLVVPK